MHASNSYISFSKKRIKLDICQSSACLYSSHQVYKMAVIDKVSVQWFQIKVELSAPHCSKCWECWRGMNLQHDLRSLTTAGARTSPQINSMMCSHPHNKESSLSPLAKIEITSHTERIDGLENSTLAGNIFYFKQKRWEERIMNVC